MRTALCYFTRFTGHERGSVSVMFGVMAIFLFAMIGAALDFGKWHNASKHTETAMDNALLAAGRQLQTEPEEPAKSIEEAQLYFNQAMAAGVKIDGLAPQFSIVDQGMGIEGTVEGAVKTPFLSLIAIPDLDVRRTAKVAFNASGGSGSTIELAMMLDVTGSMCADGEGPCTTSIKMDALKMAAKDLVSIVVRDGSNARAALVPFSTRVRVAESGSAAAGPLMKKLTDLDATWTGWQSICTAGSGSGGSEGVGNWTCTATASEHETNWKIMPCVSDRSGVNEFTDAAPGPNDWLNAHQGNRHPVSEDSGTTPLASGKGLTAADPSVQWNYINDGSCADIMPANTIMPLTNSTADLTARIDALEAYGSTAGALGTAWSWYVMSPKWSAIWNGASLPGPYGDLTALNASGKPKLRKIAVLMTDGDFNTYRTWKDAIPQDVSNNAKAICTNMKAQGIEIFTVGFELDQLPAAKKAMAIDTLQSCGTDINHFYNSLDAEQLKTSFRDIALKLSELYVER